jgi:hypothetical protein
VKKAEVVREFEAMLMDDERKDHSRQTPNWSENKPSK